jgi:hydroxypyruvate reductase/glycerate 2-kinase
MPSKEKEFLNNTYHKIIDAVQPDALYKKYLHVFDNTLYYRNTLIDLETSGKLVLAGSGKASLSMGKAILPYLKRKPDNSLFISPSEPSDTPFTVMQGNHPIPDKKSLTAGICMFKLIDSLTENDTLIYFLSGGSSSLLEYPVPGISLEDIQKSTESFLSLGMSINEINILRGAMSQIKAGKLAKICKAKSYIFVLSDVMGNDLSVIGSGPFYKTPVEQNIIEDLIAKYKLEDCLPEHLIEILNTYKPLSDIHNITHYLIGSNMDLFEAVELICFDQNIRPLSFPESLFGEAKQTGKMIADMIKLYTGPKPICMIFGGETTVTLNKNPGKGGRSQELALSVLAELQDTPGITLLSAGSDGMDGVGGATGAIVSAHTYKKAQELNLCIEKYLEKHDSYHFHKKCESLIEIGYTGTNVGDVVLALIK